MTIESAHHVFRDHTGELELEIEAPSLPELYAEAGRALRNQCSCPAAWAPLPSSCSVTMQRAARDIALASCCHGAGRAMSRRAAKRAITEAELHRELTKQGIVGVLKG